MTIDGTSDLEIIVKVRVEWTATLCAGAPFIELGVIKLRRALPDGTSRMMTLFEQFLDDDTLATMKAAIEEEAAIAQDEAENAPAERDE